MNQAPLIGVTASTVSDSSMGCGWAYLRALRLGGAVPVVLTPDAGSGSVRALRSRLDGILFTGGPDVDPSRYGAARHPAANLMAPEREAWDLEVMAMALSWPEMPILAICLGIQELNVAAGGTLVQHIPDLGGAIEHRAPEQGDRWHDAEVQPGTRVAAMVGSGVLRVNTRHHQAIDRVGAGLRVVACAPDGVIEAVESEDPERFAVGLQWHPERITDVPPHDRIFRAFAAACAAP